MEEFGELCGGIAKNKPDVIKDSIGDCYVVMIILSKQLRFTCKPAITGKVLNDIIAEFNEKKYEYSSVNEQTIEAMHHIGGFSLPALKGWKVTTEYFELLYMNLILIALFNQIDFIDCVEHAYNQIKDRKGKMIDGVFVKEEDL
ncbi:hypothetical protein A4G19_12325 [Pasteurellaceae bacterium Macca]|nr:hypothetical protein [Pasteurellaceae bacterium Macca]